MRMKLVVLLCVLLLSGRQCLAEDIEPTVVEQAKAKLVYVKPNKPQDAVLAMSFDSAKDSDKLIFSTAMKDGVDADLAKYDGKWEVEVPKTSAIEEDYALILKSGGKHHAAAIDLGKDFTFDKDEFVVQYDVKFMEGQSCGGAYIKLLSASKDINLVQFQDKTPYTIMFGPDKCGMDSKIHFIFRHKHPKTGKLEEKHMKQPTESLESFFTDKSTHLYTLVIRSDNSFEVYIDQSLIKSGNLLSEFTPPVNPPNEIDDPNDKKPSEWDDRVQIPDPAATKPEDWDEDAPQFVKDEAATMPEGWLVDELKLVAKPDAEQPADWDMETDGEWEPPMVDNPACESAPGCGKWEKPMIPNPAYKGKWSVPMIANTQYKGEWKPKRISNPDYFEDTEPYRMTPVRALGLELWSMSPDIAFDDFYIGHSKKGADAFAEETWAIKRTAEKATNAANARSVVDAIRDLATDQPLVLVGVVSGIAIVIGLIVFLCCRWVSRFDDDVHFKKTDAVTKDDSEEEEKKTVASDDAKKSYPEESEEGEEDEEEVEEKNGDKEEEVEEKDGDKEEEEVEEEEEEEEPKKKNVRQRTRKE